jgi:hypothetical protein
MRTLPTGAAAITRTAATVGTTTSRQVTTLCASAGGPRNRRGGVGVFRLSLREQDLDARAAGGRAFNRGRRASGGGQEEPDPKGDQENQHGARDEEYLHGLVQLLHGLATHSINFEFLPVSRSKTSFGLP